MKKISLKNVVSSLTRDEMKKIMAGSGGGGIEGCGFCTDPSDPGRQSGCIRPSGGGDCYCSMWVAGCY